MPYSANNQYGSQQPYHIMKIWKRKISIEWKEGGTLARKRQGKAFYWLGQKENMHTPQGEDARVWAGRLMLFKSMALQAGSLVHCPEQVEENLREGHAWGTPAHTHTHTSHTPASWHNNSLPQKAMASCLKIERKKERKKNKTQYLLYNS